MKTLWRIKDEDKELVAELADKLTVDAKLIRLLVNRGHRSVEEIKEFLNPNTSGILNPFLLSGLKEAVLRIRKAIENGDKIGIFADSDLDGLTSLALLMNVLSKSVEDISYRFPRESETYGLSKAVIDEFKEKGTKLIITVDSGIRDREEIGYALSLGMDVIVTDHHEPDDILPEAVIVNPKLKDCSYPFKHLAGVGVAFKVGLGFLMSYLPVFDSAVVLLSEKEGQIFSSLIENCVPAAFKSFEAPALAAEYISLLNTRKEAEIAAQPGKKFFVICETLRLTEIMSDLIPCPVLPLASLLPKSLDISSTNPCCRDIALALSMNMCKDDGELFTDIFFGLQLLNSRKLGWFVEYALSLVAIGSIADMVPLVGENRVLTACGLAALSCTSHKGLAKILGNGRISSKKIGWDLAPLLNSPGRFGKAELTADFFLCGDEEASDTLKHITSINNSRKRRIEELLVNGEEGDCRISDKGLYVMAACFNTPSGFAGLIANRLADIYAKPAIVLIYPAIDGLLKGSGRAPVGCNFFSVVELFPELFNRLGGHAQAFGFSIAPHRVSELEKKVLSALKEVEIMSPVIDIDLTLSPEEIGDDLIKLFDMAEPFGKDNEEPVVLMKSVQPCGFLKFGRDNVHGKFMLCGGRLTALGWRMAECMETLYNSSNPIDIVCTIEQDPFPRGNRGIRLILRDIASSDL